MQYLNNAINLPKFFTGLCLCNLTVWLLAILPNIYFKGLFYTLISLRSSPRCFELCILLFASIADFILFGMHKLYFYYLGLLAASERSLIFDNFINDNSPLMLIIIILGEKNQNSVETTIWAIVFMVFACMRAFCRIIITRLQDNKLRNLEEINKIICFMNIAFVFCTIMIFKKASIGHLVILIFESVFIFKDTSLAYYQLSMTKIIPGSTELFLQIMESLFKIIQWAQFVVVYGELFTAGPVEFLVMIKINGYFYVLMTQTKQYLTYKNSIEQFMMKYSELSAAELSTLGEEKCCVCLDLLNTDRSCKITCGHILHIECIYKWMLRNTDRICPICKQMFLQPNNDRDSVNWYLWLMRLLNLENRITEDDIGRLREMFPNLSEQEVIREIERTGSVQNAIESLLGD
ncbi:hypothetical protein SteCoe_34186 [Stentor coeruleus]|uniref:RING-type domain-containing protein n=1 Tax=Stentor coeruleus TaxID=5963 RepID=A0A1R2AV36_9CILI|nr:hypothetical protein SteCoe_34186 [Stentor coeruleus]